MRGYLPAPGIPSYGQGFARCAAEAEYPELWKGLVGLWAPYLGPTGLTLHDWGGRKNHGTLTNMDPATDWETSHLGHNLYFDGTFGVAPHYVECGNVCNLTSPLSITAWFYYVDWGSSTYRDLCGRSNPVSAQPYYQFGLRISDTSIVFLYDKSGVADAIAVAHGGITANTWYFACGVHDGINARVYFNGGNTTASEAGGSIGQHAGWKMQIGTARAYASSNSTFIWKGGICLVQVYDRALVPSEVQDLYEYPHALTRPRRLILPAAAAPAAHVGPLVNSIRLKSKLQGLAV